MFTDEVCDFGLMVGIDIRSVRFKLVRVHRASDTVEFAVACQLIAQS
jgi:hypothetical protein